MAVVVDTGPVAYLVEEKFRTSADFANDLWNVAKEYLDEMQGGLYSFSMSEIDTEISPIDTDIMDPAAPEEPTKELSLPDAPDDISLSETSIDHVTVPSLAAVAPDITIPAKPIITWPTDLGESPSFIEPDIPTKPSYTLPVAPTIEDITIPSLPDLEIPSFEGELPIDDVDLPQSIFVYDEPAYQSALRDAVDAKLLKDIQDGGTGLATDVEAALWERARDRLALKNEQMYDEAENYFSSRGFSLPPGALSSKLAEIAKEQARADQQLNYEVAIEQARLAQTNTHFIITSAIQQEANIMTYVSGVATRTLDAAKYAQETAIAIFNAAVAKYNQKLATYQTCAVVYESRIKAAGLILENYKVQLEGVRIVADVQKLYVDVYNSQIAAVSTLIELYKTEMETATIQANIELLKLEGFKGEVEVYTAKVNAIVSNYNAYQAEVAGEAAKASVYAEQVRAYVGEVGAKKTEADINIAEANLVIEANKIKVEELRAKIERYNTEIGANVAEIKTEAEVYGYDIERYKADISQAAAEIGANIEKYKAESMHSRNIADVKLAQSALFFKEADIRHALDLEIAKASSSIAAQMAASALSAVAAGVQMSVRASLSGEVGEFYNHNLSV